MKKVFLQVNRGRGAVFEGINKTLTLSLIVMYHDHLYRCRFSSIVLCFVL
jgi:hypothetical protein